MGSYHSFLQSLSSGIKLFLLFGLALLICFPSFYIVQLILGSKIRIGHMLTIILSGFDFISAIMLAFAPIVVFFQLRWFLCPSKSKHATVSMRMWNVIRTVANSIRCTNIPWKVSYSF